MPNLGRSVPNTYQGAGRPGQRQPGPQLLGEELCLVEASLPQPVRVERDRQRPRAGEALDHEALREQQGERARHPPPALIFEALNRELDRSLVGNR